MSLWMKARLVILGSSLAGDKVGGGWRLIGMKASDRAAVHGTKPPMPDIVDKETVEMEIERAREEKEKKRKEIEDTVDSQLKNKDWEPISDNSSTNS